MKEPKKPKNVPQEALWNVYEEEWELGEKNKNGNKIGEWKWWLAPKGHLCCHTFFNDKGEIISSKRFHPNGEVSLELSYNEDGEEVSIYYKSTQDTNEYFPDSSFSTSWKAEKKVGVSPRSYTYYDKQGNLLVVSNDSDMESLKNGPTTESAEQALHRLENVIDLIKANENIDAEFLEDLDAYHKPYCIETITEEQLIEAEKELGITFPVSYKNFVLKNGLIGFGESNEFNRKMFTDYESLSVELENSWEVNLEKEFSKEAKQRLDKIITFSYGDEGLQLEWFHCFDFNTLHPKTGEVTVVDFCQDDYYYLTQESDHICEGNGFDKHMSSIVDQQDFGNDIVVRSGWRL